MKFTQVLYKYHIGKAIRYLWQHQRERPIIVTKAEDILRSMNIPVQNAMEVVLQKPPQIRFVPEKRIEESILSHTAQPEWNDRSCLIFEDQNVLHEGVSQACLLTKTLQVGDDLPQKVEKLVTTIPGNINRLIIRLVYTSAIYDAEQVKLQRLHDPDRPAWRFPRVYGISTKRKMYNLSKKFLQLCESLSGLSIAQNRLILEDGLSSVCVDQESDFIKFSSKMDIFMASSTPLTPIVDVNTQYEFDMPSIHPMHHTIGLRKLTSYNSEDVYPINSKCPFVNPHTLFILYDSENVKNITELPVIENQIHAHSLTKSFTVAAACARQRFGAHVKELPEPIVVQCVQSDGQDYHFSVYQLNTLDIDGTQGIKNFWWSKPTIKLYEEAKYENGQPCVKEYNSEVFKRFFAFYKNQ